MLIQFARSVAAMSGALCSSILPLIPAIIDFDCAPTPERWAEYRLTKLDAFVQTRFFFRAHTSSASPFSPLKANLKSPSPSASDRQLRSSAKRKRK